MNAGFSAMKHCEQEGNLVTLTRVAEHASKSAIIWRREVRTKSVFTLHDSKSSRELTKAELPNAKRPMAALPRVRFFVFTLRHIPDNCLNSRGS